MAITLKGYIYVWDAKRKRHNYEHRIIMEKHLKRNLLPTETVHHIDGNKKNNAIENLVVLSVSDHAIQAWKDRKEKWLWSRKHNKCIDCGTTERSHHANGRCKNCDMRYRRT